jgi:SAM-dependent methyltransferase
LPKSLDAEDFHSVPFFILSFNQVSYLTKLVAWLLAAEYPNLCIVDNNSTYEPLHRFYNDLNSHSTVKVVRRTTNTGPLALWEENLLDRFGVTGPFVYTDSDVVPDDRCPADIVAHLAAILRSFSHIFKAGPGLRIDNLPTTYKFHREVFAWERRFWREPVARGLFLADIDTTFALYRPESHFDMRPAIRTGWPYLARHESWYADSSNPSEEQTQYTATIEATPHGHWTRNVLPAWLQSAIDASCSSPPPRLLHLGCGHEIIPGWINLDLSSDVGADVVFDLDSCGPSRLPIENDSIDGFFMCHVFEHIERTLPMMQELYRVAKPDARFIIRLPHGATDDAFEDPTHRRAYFPNSFVYFAQPAYSRADYNYLGDWRVARVKLVVGSDLLSSESEQSILQRVARERNIVREMIVELRAVKPARPRELRLLEWPTATVTDTAIDADSVFA